MGVGVAGGLWSKLTFQVDQNGLLLQLEPDRDQHGCQPASQPGIMSTVSDRSSDAPAQLAVATVVDTRVLVRVCHEEPATRAQDASHLGKHIRRMLAKLQNANADDGVEGLVLERQVVPVGLRKVQGGRDLHGGETGGQVDSVRLAVNT